MIPQQHVQIRYFKRKPRRPRWVKFCCIALIAVAFSAPLWIHFRLVSKRVQGSIPQPQDVPILQLGDIQKDFAIQADERKQQDEGRRPVHFIYTVGCGGASDPEWQLLQSNVLDSSFRAVKQRGKLTRLVSGCVEDKDEKMRAYMSRSILDSSIVVEGSDDDEHFKKRDDITQLQVVFVPNQERVKAGDSKRIYVQANRPTALRIFFTQHVQHEDEDTVYVVIDPDFVFRKSFPEDAIESVAERQFVTQFYGLQNPSSYAFTACQEALNGTAKATDCQVLNTVAHYKQYFAGVPYMLLRSDWTRLLEYWIPLIGPVLLRYPGIESDMISWSIAAVLANTKPAQQRDDLMATCMSSESADVDSVLRKQVFLHLCQSYYVPEIRPNPEYKVNQVAELLYIVSPKWMDKETEYVYVFNKHWLHKSKLLDDCSIPLLLGPPPLSAASSGGDISRSSRLRWYQFTIEEAIAAYNRAVVEFRNKFHSAAASDEGETCSTRMESVRNKALIMHEMHRGRFNGGWNHMVSASAT